MSILITFVSNITVLVSHKIIFFGFFKPMSHGVNKKTSTLHVSCPHLHPPTRFLPGFFVVVQEILYQPYFTMIRLFMKDNKFSKKVRFFLLVHGWLILILLFCSYVFFYGSFFFTVLPSWNHEPKVVVVFWVPRKPSLRFTLPP